MWNKQYNKAYAELRRREGISIPNWLRSQSCLEVFSYFDIGLEICFLSSCALNQL